MVNLIQLTSFDKNTVIKIDKGELVSFINNNKEIIHQKEVLVGIGLKLKCFQLLARLLKTVTKFLH